MSVDSTPRPGSAADVRPESGRPIGTADTGADAGQASRAGASAAGVGVLDGSLVSAQDVSVGFGSFTVLSAITVDFAPRAVNALIGPTGCGKSTFLRSINRMNDKVSGYWRTGALELDGTDVADTGLDPLVLRRRVGMVFQRPNPFPMSIRDNVLAGVKVHRLVPKSEFGDVAERSLREVGLWGAVANRLNDSPFRLSGGQQQLLCLARALAVGPEVLLLDEPTSSLDPVTTDIVEDLLRQLAPTLTMVVVTHNLAQARRVSTTTTFLYNGRLVETGDTARLFDSPSEPETVSYVSGRMG
jgi:phosphate transport system ATP-binding protein